MSSVGDTYAQVYTVLDESVMMAYADGGVILRNPSTIGGAWAWCHVNGFYQMINHDSGLLIPTRKWSAITNNYAEYVAAVRCLEALPEGWDGSLVLDSQITIGRLFSGWSMEGIPPSIQERGKTALMRLGAVKGVLIEGHPTKEHLTRGYGEKGRPVSEHNVFCDLECSRIMQAYAMHGGKP